MILDEINSFLSYYILFYSIIFYYILFYSILLYSILLYSIIFYSILIAAQKTNSTAKAQQILKISDKNDTEKDFLAFFGTHFLGQK